MDFKPFIDGLQNDLKEANLMISNPVKRANHAIRLSHTLLSLLRKSVVKDGFESIDKEIAFFKTIKTVPSAKLIYHSQIRSFELEFPKGNTNTQRKFIKKRLNRLNRFYHQHMDFGEYIESGRTHFDEKYFTRKYLNSFPIVSPHFYFHDPEFNTPKDMLLAEFMGFNSFLSYLQNRMIDQSKIAIGKPFDLNTQISLQWTATKSALTELIYALHYNKVINNGNTDIKEIALAMQQVFHFDLGDFYKIFSEIKSRKISRTKFLNDLASGLQSHMDNAEE
ncbi:RteC domain-containing protein [uncultured Maribacter sp.]|uniref:RteC domain-containing protein n=1 Tax=uncultured Maribacter sp. TaxID=431308 RepID=UPI00260D70CB|nr:RteC domain-containing protein [uncultured Maribacter sp.]